MSFLSWLRNRTPSGSRGRGARGRSVARRFHACFEALEDRVVPSNGPTILKVTDLSDSAKANINNLRNAIQAADKDTNKTYEIDITTSGPITLESPLPDLANNITIKGLGIGSPYTTIQRDTAPGTPSFRIFTVDAGNTVVLSGMTIANGNTGRLGAGGGIDNLGSLTLTNCLLVNDTAVVGGAVSNEDGANLTVNGSGFFGNHASGSGGAIYSSVLATLVAESTLFNANTANGSGGAIFNESSHTNVGGCFFNGNHALGTANSDMGGGAIWNDGSIVVQDNGFLGNSRFFGNTASQLGGAIDNFGQATVNDVTFGDGTAAGQNSATSGGAIENRTNARLTSLGTSFSGNTAAYGGAIDSQSGATVLAVTGASFTGNTANFLGGAIDTHTIGATFSGCTFTGNKSRVNTGSGYDGGGAIWNDGSVTVQSTSSFSGNTAVYAGGAIDNFGTAIVSQTTFGDGTTAGQNSAQYGGAIMNWSDLGVKPGTSFTGNAATSLGGAIDSVGGTLIATGASFTNNTAVRGGAVASSGNADISTCTFTANQAVKSTGSDGGAILNFGTLTVQANSTFSGNGATGYGGAISNFATANVSQSSFTSTSTTPGNTSAFGGAIVNWTGATLNLYAGSGFADNTANYGGAILNWGAANVTASFATNRAVAGGAIENGAGASLTIYAGSAFTGNTADYGGAIDSQSGTTLFAVSGTTFVNNTANVQGGAINNHSGATASGCTFTSNHALGSNANSSEGGGAIWNDGALTVQGNSSFSGNTAVYAGGAIDNFGTATVTQTAFTNAGSTPQARFGGAIFNQAGILTIYANTSFTGNIAVDGGGAIFNFGTLTSSGASFTNNHAGVGGGAILNLATANIAGGSFWYNSTTTSGGTGGAILNRGDLTVSSCEMTLNTAAFGGGAIYNLSQVGSVRGAVLTMTGCQAVANSASYGGGLENDGGVMAVSGCDVEGNTASNLGGGIITVGNGTTNVLFGSYVANNNDSSGADDSYTESGSTLNVDAYSIVVVRH